MFHNYLILLEFIRRLINYNQYILIDMLQHTKMLDQQEKLVSTDILYIYGANSQSRWHFLIT